jgi:hypothetical protein
MKQFSTTPERKGPQSPEELIRFYQELGFFARRGVARVLADYKRHNGLSMSEENSWYDPELLLCDEKATWHDCGSYAAPRNCWYRDVLPYCAKLTRGAFAPTDIQEHWQTERGPIRVSFRLGEHTVIVWAQPQEKNHADFGYFRQIDSVLPDTGGHFECAGSYMKVVMWLTREQKQKMLAVRNFPFHW